MPSDYTTLEAVKQSLNIPDNGTADDAFLGDLIPRASRAIERYCGGRNFVAETETRYFDAAEDVRGQVLFVDKDLVEVTAIVNGDGDTLPDSAFVTEPRNQTPKYGIRLKAGSGITWTFQTDPEDAIAVTAKWGYAEGTPADIEQACVRLVVYWYKLRKNPFLEVGIPETGQIAISAAIPNDIQVTLNPYIRQNFR